VDSIAEEAWRKIDRPHGSLQLASILDGMLRFAQDYQGELVTETMLVQGANDDEGHVQEIGDFLARLGPAVAYLAIPIRPPAEDWVQPPGEAAINRAYQILGQRVDRVEYLIGYEGNAFAFTGDIEGDLLSITSVHPMREDAVGEFLARAGAEWPVVRQLIDRGQLVETAYEGRKFYVRKLRGV
jgi:wyosine [tRNA(Phe)-imidazoG37] synthetase (radical SAM superfamily)